MKKLNLLKNTTLIVALFNSSYVSALPTTTVVNSSKNMIRIQCSTATGTIDCQMPPDSSLPIEGIKGSLLVCYKHAFTAPSSNLCFPNKNPLIYISLIGDGSKKTIRFSTQNPKKHE